MTTLAEFEDSEAEMQSILRDAERRKRKSNHDSSVRNQRARSRGNEAVAMTDQPSKAEISRFLEFFAALEKFELQQRFVRGYGAFGPEWKWPDQAVADVAEWLSELATDGTEPPEVPTAATDESGNS
jgi:hypothetical protein